MFHVDIGKNILIQYEMEKYFCMILKIYKFIFRSDDLTFTNAKFFYWILIKQKSQNNSELFYLCQMLYLYMVHYNEGHVVVGLYTLHE